MKKGFLTAIILVLSFLFISEASFAGTIKGDITVKKSRRNRTILVYIDEVKGKTFAPPEAAAKMDQKDVKFVPHILPILAGTTVEFLNNDPQKHNVFGFGDNEDFNLGVWKQGGSEKYTFKNIGPVTTLCNIHAEMEGYIVVLQNPYFALTDETGSYEISNVPAGSYTLRTWNEKVKPGEQEVTVTASGDVVADFELRR